MGKLELFHENGYLNIPSIRAFQEEHNLPYSFIWGSRGIGKTYGVLTDEVRRNKEEGEKFIMMRRTAVQTSLIMNEKFMPFKSVNKHLGTTYRPFSVGSGMYGFFESELVNNKYTPVGEEIGLAMPVSTSGNTRGYDGSDIGFVFYDEFIPLKSERPIKGEGELLFNALETIQRNRELEGGKPVIFMGLSNSNNVDNPYFMELGLVNRALKMGMEKDNVTYIDQKRGLLLVCVNNSPIAARKKDTSLYRLAEGTSYIKMALDNDFVGIDTKAVKSMDLRHYDPVVELGGICVYKSKSEPSYYISGHVKGSPAHYSTSEIDIVRFRKKYWNLYSAYMNDRIIFENHSLEYLFQIYMKI